MMRQMTVELQIEIDVTLPVDVPDSAVNQYGVVIDRRLREAAIGAAIGSMPQSCEIDVSGALNIPFHTTGEQCSLARVFNHATDNDLVEVSVQ